MTEPGFSGTQTAKIVGITYRQLDYWARTDLLRPSLAEATGSGSRRRYSYRDLLELRVIKTLLDAGIRLESVREVFTYLRQHVTTDIAAAHIVISGNQVDALRRRRSSSTCCAGARACSTCCPWPASRTTSTPSSCRSPTTPHGGRRLRARRASDHEPASGSPLDDGPPRRRGPDGAVRRLGHAARVPDGHDRRAPRLPPGRRRVRRVAPRHGAGQRRRRARPCCSGRCPTTSARSRPGRAQYTHLLDDADGSVLDDIIVWWHPRADDGDDVFDVMPNASNTDRVRDAIGGRGDDARAGRARRAGPGGARPAGDGVPRGRRRRAASASPTPAWQRRGVHRRRHRLHGRAGRRDRRPGRRRPSRPVGRRSSAPASSRPGSAPATRCASRPGCRCTATSSARASRRCRPGWAGSWRGPSRSSAAGPRCWPSASAGVAPAPRRHRHRGPAAAACRLRRARRR